MLPRGEVCGADIWSTRDLSGNARDATLANLAAVDLAERVTIVTGARGRSPRCFPPYALSGRDEPGATGPMAHACCRASISRPAGVT